MECRTLGWTPARRTIYARGMRPPMPLIPGGPDACTAAEAAAIAGLPLRTFNRLRRRFERWYDTGTWTPVPDGATRAWRRERVIVVPEFGGASQFGSDFRYSRAACERWHEAPGVPAD